MKKLYDKDPVWFAVAWIIVYVVGFANADSLSEAMGIPKLLTVVLGLAMTLILIFFLRRHRLLGNCGLCLPQSVPGVLLYIPLVILSCVNLTGGLVLTQPLHEAILGVVSMCFVAILEELIFRGLLFRGMSSSSITIAIVVSSLTFGMGHIVNLLLGAPVGDTLLQILYASAMGFCYTALFHTTGSILPCILSHALVNSTSLFARESTGGMKVALALGQTVISIAWGLWLLYRKNHPAPRNPA